MSNLIHNNEKGFVLPVGLMFMAIIAILGTTAVIVTTTDLKIGSNYRDSKQAFYIAEAGLARAAAELINDLNTDNDLSNTSFDAISGTMVIIPSSTVFYTPSGFNNISFGAGAYTIQFKNYAPDPTAPNVYDQTTIWVRSIGTGPNSSTATLECYFSAENISPWNNAIFAGGSGGTVPITGNIVVAGSIHILGDGLLAATTVFNNQTGDCRNTNVGMSPGLSPSIAGGTSSDLNAKFRVKNGHVDMTLGTADIGSAISPFKGIYVTDGDDGDSNGVNDDIDGGDNAGAGQNLYANKGATSAEAYDLGDYNITLPPIIPANITSVDLVAESALSGTSLGGMNPYELKLDDPMGAGFNGDPASKNWLGDGATWNLCTKGIRYTWKGKTHPIYGPLPGGPQDSSLLEIKGTVKIGKLTIDCNIMYDTTTSPVHGGTIYVADDSGWPGVTNIDGKVLPRTNGTYPTANVFGVISTGNLTLPSTAQKNLTGAYYTAETATCSKSDELAGTIVCKNFNITANVPKIWQVPSLSANLPPGMPGSAAIWVFTDRTWREITE